MTKAKIEFLPYAPMYKQYYLKECSALEKILRSNCINVYHVGSTAISSISARPTLDILCVTHTLDGIMHFEDEFMRVGLKFNKALSDEKKLVFERISKDGKLILSRVFIHDKSDARVEDYLNLKDHFIKDESAAKRFEASKIEFSAQPKTYEQKKAALIELILSSL